MGMFDTIQVNLPCLNCGKNIETMQTKATACIGNYYQIGDKIFFSGVYVENGSIEVHDYCESCNYWHYGDAVIKDGKLVEVKNLVLGECIKN